MKIDLKFKIKNLKLISEILVLLGLALFYFLSRLVNLTIIPVFVDEAIYIRWAQVMRAVASLRFLPLSDGKQPLFMWLIIPFLKIFSDPLIAGRMVSVLTGFGTLTGIGIISYLLFKKKEIVIFSCILYIISPFCLFFDRMALADGLLSMFGVWVTVLSVILINNRRLDISMIAGIVLGLALLTKSPGIVFAILIPCSLLILNAHKKLTFKTKMIFANYHLIEIGKLIFFWIIIYGFSFAIYNILRLGPEFHMIAIRNKDYVFSFSEIIKHPLNPLIGNLKSAVLWYWTMLTPLIFISVIAGVFWMLVKNTKISLYLLLLSLLPLLAQSSIAKVYTARYVFFTVPYLLISASYFINKIFLLINNKIAVTLFLSLIFIFPIYQSALFLTNPQKAALPRNERSGYLEGWTAGYGIKESAEYLKKIAIKEKVLVGTEGYFGTLPDGLQIYLEKVPNITVIGVGYPIVSIPDSLKNGLRDNRVFLLVNDSRLKILDKTSLKLIASYPKAFSVDMTQENLLLFEINK